MVGAASSWYLVRGCRFGWHLEWFSLMPSEDRGCGQLWRHVKLKEERETGEESRQKTWINSRERLERMGE